MFRKLIHRIYHLLGWNEGDIISWHDTENFYISFKCKTCGEIDSKLTTKHPLIERPE